MTLIRTNNFLVNFERVTHVSPGTGGYASTFHFEGGGIAASEMTIDEIIIRLHNAGHPCAGPMPPGIPDPGDPDDEGVDPDGEDADSDSEEIDDIDDVEEIEEEEEEHEDGPGDPEDPGEPGDVEPLEELASPSVTTRSNPGRGNTR